MNKLYDIIDTIAFYGTRTNIHKIRPISKLMCYLGRHDYEIAPDANRYSTHIEIECFYCGHKKASYYQF